MDIRPERPGDEAMIDALVTAAFLNVPHRGGNEAQIVDALRRADALALSLVAIDGTGIIGHIAFSAVTIDGAARGWFGLGPVAVLPERQRGGVGAALIDAGLGGLRARAAKGCVLLGAPGYYRRFGFVADPAFRMAGLALEHSRYFQRLAFDDLAHGGLVRFHPAFGMG